MSLQTPCWDAKEFFHIVTPDAEEIEDHVFRAVHCATTLHISDTAHGRRYETAPETVIERFLEAGRRYVQLVVLGQAGTGKSHLIQWLRLNLPHTAGDMILTVPKVGTSLRRILERIIDLVPAAERPQFEEKLRTAGTQATTHRARVDKFLDALAWSIAHSGVSTEEDAALAELLPALFRDPNLRRDFFARAGTIDRLVEHIFVDPEARGEQDTRHQFERDDLPLVSGQQYLDAAFMARQAIDFIKLEPGMDERAIALMNRALEPAIAQTLNFTADDLIALMKILRIHLAREDRRLILLVEDFARLQGIDNALLQALITPPRQGEDLLCELRWAMAVTTGYFERLPDTVKERCTLVVDMDASRPASLAHFAAGYLNAIRVGEEKLRKAREGEVPNRCGPCELRRTCWEAFGHDGDVGLFPFNATALKQLAERQGAIGDRGFNPRRFLKAVLEPILMQGHSELERGTFPPSTLLDRAGGSDAIPPVLVATLERVDPVDYARRRTLLELWEGSGSLVNLPHGIHEAFGLQELPSTVTVAAPPLLEGAQPVASIPDGQAKPDALVDALHAWSGSEEAMLSQSDVDKLRGHVFAALDSFIDWDALGFKKSEVCQDRGGALFVRTSINFDRQQTQKTQKAVTLHLPLPGRKMQTAVALEALVRSKEHGGWDFPGGGEQLSYLLNELHLWADEISSQLASLLRGEGDWDPSAACAELLVLAGVQGRRIKHSDSAEEMLEKLFDRPECPAFAGSVPLFTKLNGRLAATWRTHQDLLRALCAGSKGGAVSTVFFLRAAPVLEAIRTLRKRRYRLEQRVPGEAQGRVRQTDILGRLAALGDVYREVQERYPEAVETERSAWTSWREQIFSRVGEDVRVSQIADSLRHAILDAENFGIGISSGALRDQIEALDARKADQALDHARALDDANDGEAVARIAIATPIRPQIDALLAKAGDFLDRLDERLAARRTQIELSVGDGLIASQRDIGVALDRLVDALSALAGSEQ